MDSGREGSCMMGDRNKSLGYPESELSSKISSSSTSFMKIYISPHNPHPQHREPWVSIWEFAMNLLFYMTLTFLHDLRLPVLSALIFLGLQHFINLPFLSWLPWYLFLISTLSVLCSTISCSMCIFYHLWQWWFSGQKGGRCESGWLIEKQSILEATHMR